MVGDSGPALVDAEDGTDGLVMLVQDKVWCLDETMTMEITTESDSWGLFDESWGSLSQTAGFMFTRRTSCFVHP